MRAAKIAALRATGLAARAGEAACQVTLRALDALPTRNARRARAFGNGLTDDALARFLAPDWTSAP